MRIIKEKVFDFINLTFDTTAGHISKLNYLYLCLILISFIVAIFIPNRVSIIIAHIVMLVITVVYVIGMKLAFTVSKRILFENITSQMDRCEIEKVLSDIDTEDGEKDYPFPSSR